MEYRFLRWSEDGGALLLHYREVVGRSGYFWYDIRSGEADGVWEMGETDGGSLGGVDAAAGNW